jgi:hypothetical protein
LPDVIEVDKVKAEFKDGGIKSPSTQVGKSKAEGHRGKDGVGPFKQCRL